jgi:hypothetical protein
MAGEAKARQGMLAAVGACAAVLATLAAGCLDEEGPLRCVRQPASGGNPVGIWEFMDYCLEPKPEVVAGCPEMKIEYEGTQALGGTIELRADGRFIDNTVSTQSARIEAPLRCFPSASGCAQVGQLFRGALENPMPPDATRTTAAGVFCRGDDLCRCVLTTRTTAHIDSMYSLSGATYTIPTETAEFSVLGNELRIQSAEWAARLLRK